MKRYIILFTIALFASCASKDLQMDRTVFIPDQLDGNLPAYTEWGYNTFGAKVDRNYFLVSYDITPCKILYKNGKLSFSLSGNFVNYNNVTMTFTFPSEQLKEYTDLLTLNNIDIDLKASDCEVTLTQNETTETLNLVEGELHFIRAQMLMIDEQPNRVILSGVFAFRYLNGTNEFPVSVSDGRFDVGINKNVFYAY